MDCSGFAGIDGGIYIWPVRIAHSFCGQSCVMCLDDIKSLLRSSRNSFVIGPGGRQGTCEGWGNKYAGGECAGGECTDGCSGMLSGGAIGVICCNISGRGGLGDRALDCRGLSSDSDGGGTRCEGFVARSFFDCIICDA